METTSQAGWYADPMGRHTHRWWSGEHWTEHIADAGHAGVDPLHSATTDASNPSVTAPTTPATASAAEAGIATAAATTAAPQTWGAPPAGAPAPTSAPAPTANPAPVAAPVTQAPAAPPPVAAAQPTTAPTSVVKSPQRPRWLIGAGIVGVAALLIGGIVLFTGGSDDDSSSSGSGALPGAGEVVSAGETVTIDSMSDGQITTSDGVSVAVPAGAVPRSAAGEPGSIAFSVEVADDLGEVDTSNLPADVSIADTVYEFGPTGQSFDAPVTIEIPLGDVDPATVGGVAYFDQGTRTWQQVTGTVDADANVVRAGVMHFSLYTYWFHNTTDGQTQEQAERANGGWISITNEVVGAYGWDRFPSTLFGYDQPHYPYTNTSYGVCVAGWDLDDPSYESQMSWFGTEERPLTVEARVARNGWAESGGTTEYWLPAGTYDLVEVWYPSEINWGGDPMYVPLVGSAYRPIGPVTIEPGETISYVEEQNIGGNPGTGEGWIPERAPCLGQPMPSLGSGSVQVSLNWPQDGIDLDLYVTDPSGEEIYYSNPASASGGTLDFDNQSGGGIPENIFWADTAPAGDYEVRVDYYGGDGAASWTVSVLVDGNRTSFSGTIAEGSTDVTSFTVG